MGAIFSTPNTVAILSTLNNHYQGANFTAARNRGEHATLRDFGTFPDSHSCARRLNLNPSNAALDLRWKKWLDNLDSSMQGGVSAGRLVRNAMADAIDPATTQCNGLEFFAVPGNSFNVHLPPPTVNDLQNPGFFSVEIVVETQIIDVLPDPRRGGR